jgi:hypothetical protein
MIAKCKGVEIDDASAQYIDDPKGAVGRRGFTIARERKELDDTRAIHSGAARRVYRRLLIHGHCRTNGMSDQEIIQRHRRRGMLAMNRPNQRRNLHRMFNVNVLIVPRAATVFRWNCEVSLRPIQRAGTDTVLFYRTESFPSVGIVDLTDHAVQGFVGCLPIAIGSGLRNDGEESRSALLLGATLTSSVSVYAVNDAQGLSAGLLYVGVRAHNDLRSAAT